MSARPVGPPSWEVGPAFARSGDRGSPTRMRRPGRPTDRKSTRLNSSHSQISYAVFCLKKKKEDHPHGILDPVILPDSDYDDHLTLILLHHSAAELLAFVLVVLLQLLDAVVHALQLRNR